MQAATLMAALQKAAQAPRLAGIHIRSVEIAAIHDWLHDPVISITWTMPDASNAIDATALSLPGVHASVISRPSNTCMVLGRDLASPDEIESAVMDCAWTMGAWDISRLEQAPLPDDADWREPRYGLMSDFGRNPYNIAGQPLAVGESAEDAVCEIAAANGWIIWTFVPMVLASPSFRQRYAAMDASLSPDGGRVGGPGLYRSRWYHPSEPRTGHQHIYELGRGTGKVSAANRQARRAIARAGDKK